MKNIQQEVNIEQFAANGQLDKVKVKDLRKWLRQRHIPFHAKEKHQQVVHLVNSHIFK